MEKKREFFGFVLKQPRSQNITPVVSRRYIYVRGEKKKKHYFAAVCGIQNRRKHNQNRGI